MTTALEGSEGSASRPGRTLPPGKIRYPLYRRLGGPQGRSGQVRKISPPTGIRSPDHPTRSQSLYQLSYRAHTGNSALEEIAVCLFTFYDGGSRFSLYRNVTNIYESTRRHFVTLNPVGIQTVSSNTNCHSDTDFS
jgi:hypothetical protein